MDQQFDMTRLIDMRGEAVYSSDGEKIGKVEDIYYDEGTNTPEWIGIGTGFFSTKHVLVPVEGATIAGDRLTVPFAKNQVKDAPDIDRDELTEDDEHQLFEHYGLRRGMARGEAVTEAEAGRGMRSSTGAGAGGRHADGDMSLTRSEEELRVGKREVAAGTVRLRKWVETTPVQEQVQLRRETAHIERQPLNDPATDAAIGEDSVEVELRREEAVVDKRTVAKERVGIERDAEQVTETVDDEIRRERVEVEGGEAYGAAGGASYQERTDPIDLEARRK